jgi:LAS superfamily LD-carboxypeptidase LdcB
MGTLSTQQQQREAQWLLEQVAKVNPYNRQQANSKEEFYIYQSGFLASYLVSLMREDHFIQQRFLRHLDKIKSPK